MPQQWIDFQRGDDLMHVEMIAISIIAIIVCIICVFSRGYV